MKKHILLFIIILFSCELIYAQGYLNDRFYPSTITIDEPFVSDKLLLTIYRTEAPADSGGDQWTTNPKVLYAKTITPNLQASITESYLHIQNPGQNPQNGFDNSVVGLRYVVAKHPQAESIISIALNATIGGTGSHIVNASSNTTLTPEILLGQGFANIPDSIKYLRPLAVILAISPDIVTNNYTITNINVGIALQYSLPFLQQFVKNFNLPWMDHLVPTVELPITICTQGSCSGHTTGNIEPGFIIYNKYGQIGLEAIIPSNNYTGSKIGGVLQLHLYFDGIFPNSLGKPIFS